MMFINSSQPYIYIYNSRFKP